MRVSLRARNSFVVRGAVNGPRLLQPKGRAALGAFALPDVQAEDMVL